MEVDTDHDATGGVSVKQEPEVDSQLDVLQPYIKPEPAESNDDDDEEDEVLKPPPKKRPRIRVKVKVTASAINFIKLFDLTSTPDSTIEFCRSMGLLPKSVLCPSCGDVLDHIPPWKDGAKNQALIFKCGKKLCKSKGARSYKVNARKNTFFEGQELSFRSILVVAYAFVARLSVEQARREASTRDLRLTNVVVHNLYSFCRQVCVNALLNKNSRLGGPGRSVEIDMNNLKRTSGTCFSDIYQNDGQWVLGGICRETDECFMVVVEDRSQDNLISIIEDKVEKGSKVFTRGFKDLSRLKALGFKYQTVNQRKNFVDPKTGASTNKIQATWWAVRRFLPTAVSNLSDNLAEYVWRKGRDPATVFNNFLEEIVCQFPGPCQQLSAARSSSSNSLRAVIRPTAPQRSNHVSEGNSLRGPVIRPTAPQRSNHVSEGNSLRVPIIRPPSPQRSNNESVTNGLRVPIIPPTSLEHPERETNDNSVSSPSVPPASLQLNSEVENESENNNRPHIPIIAPTSLPIIIVKTESLANRTTSLQSQSPATPPNFLQPDGNNDREKETHSNGNGLCSPTTITPTQTSPQPSNIESEANNARHPPHSPTIPLNFLHQPSDDDESETNNNTGLLGLPAVIIAPTSLLLTLKSESESETINNNLVSHPPFPRPTSLQLSSESESENNNSLSIPTTVIAPTSQELLIKTESESETIINNHNNSGSLCVPMIHDPTSLLQLSEESELDMYSCSQLTSIVSASQTTLQASDDNSSSGDESDCRHAPNASPPSLALPLPLPPLPLLPPPSDSSDSEINSRHAPNRPPISLRPSDALQRIRKKSVIVGSSASENETDTIVDIFLGQESIAFRRQLPGRSSVILTQIKALVTEKAPTDKYFFKCERDGSGGDAGTACVFEEVFDDGAVVPMWRDKIVVKVVKADT